MVEIGINNLCYGDKKIVIKEGIEVVGMLDK